MFYRFCPASVVAVIGYLSSVGVCRDRMRIFRVDARNGRRCNWEHKKIVLQTMVDVDKSNRKGCVLDDRSH
jgi:hypothetical protein